MKIAMPVAQVVGWPGKRCFELRKRRAIIDGLWRSEDGEEQFELILRILSAKGLTPVEFAELVLDAGEGWGMYPTKWRRIETQQGRSA
jgi:hypothetical protein